MILKRSSAASSGSKPDRETLRREMLQNGSSIAEISAEMAQRWGFRPRSAWRHALSLTQDDVAERYNNLGEAAAARMTAKRVSEYENWPVGGVKPPIHYLIRLAEVYDAPNVGAIADYHDRRAMPAEDNTVLLACIQNDEQSLSIESLPEELNPASEVGRAVRRSALPLSRQLRIQEVLRPPLIRQKGGIGEVVMSAADEASRYASAAESSNVAEATLDELNSATIQLAQGFLNGDILAQLYEAIRIRKRVHHLLDGRQYPRQTSQLYYLAGILSCLLADASNNLGYPGAAGEQARSGWAYAEILGNDALKAWVRSFQSLLTDRAGRPKQAIALANSGLEVAHSPASQILLKSRAALASAHLGDSDEAQLLLRNATDLRDSANGDDELFEQIGGMFSCPQAKQFFLSASVYVELGLAQEAQRSAKNCIEIYEAGRPEDRAEGCETSARIDLANSQLMVDELEGASASLRPIFNIPANRRADWVTPRFNSLRMTIVQRGLQSSTISQELLGTIEDYNESMAAREIGSAVWG